MNLLAYKSSAVPHVIKFDKTWKAMCVLLDMSRARSRLARAASSLLPSCPIPSYLDVYVSDVASRGDRRLNPLERARWQDGAGSRGENEVSGTRDMSSSIGTESCTLALPSPVVLLGRDNAPDTSVDAFLVAELSTRAVLCTHRAGLVRIGIHGNREGH